MPKRPEKHYYPRKTYTEFPDVLQSGRSPFHRILLFFVFHPFPALNLILGATAPGANVMLQVAQ